MESVKMWAFTVTLVYLQIYGSVISCGTFNRQYTFQAKERVPYNHLRIKNDPDQVKSDVITQDNLFGFLNLRNLVRFKLWTRMNPQLAHEIKFKDIDSLRTSNFNPKRLTKILIHGFADTATEQSITYYLFDLKDAYLKLADLNVIIMDYSLFTMPMFYLSGFPDVASARLAELLSFLVDFGGAMLDSVHLVGFSWGAHVAGLAGFALDGQIGRITGLDPAGPSFRFVENEFRLDASDAKFVDIIHTNGGSTLLFGGHLGNSLALGHVDVFPNGGEMQIGCPKTEALIYETLECSHGRAVRFYTESITSPLAFPSCKCESLNKFVRGECPCGKEDIAFMGEHLSHNARGTYQLITRSQKPFGHGPQMNITLPDIPNLSHFPKPPSPAQNSKTETEDLWRNNSTTSDGDVRMTQAVKDHISPETPKVTVIYKDKVFTMNYTNSYSAKSLLNFNADIVTMCMEALHEANDTLLYGASNQPSSL